MSFIGLSSSSIISGATFFTVLLALIMVVWFLVRSKLISNTYKQVIKAKDGDLKRLTTGYFMVGLSLILTLIPFIGFIFIWVSAAYVSYYGRILNKISRKLKTGVNFYVFIAFLAGFVAMLFSFRNPYEPFYLSHPLLIGAMSSFFIVSAAMSFAVLSHRGLGGFVILFSLIFMVLAIAPQEVPQDGYILIAFIVFMAFFFMISSGISYGLRRKFIRGGGLAIDLSSMRSGSFGAYQNITAQAVQNTQGTRKPPVQSNRPQEPKLVPQQNPASTQSISNSANMVGMTDIDKTLVARELIAMVGPPLSGKTTFLAYFFQFVADIERITNVSIEVNPGMRLMEQYLTKIISEHKFPELTAMDKIGEVVFTFTKKKRIGYDRTHLRISDIAGERFNALQGTKDEVRRQLSKTRFEYLLRARAYLIMVDCSSYREWAIKDLEYWRILNSLLSARLEREPPKIAFVFTKTDTLPSAIDSYDALQLLEILKNTNLYVKKYVKNPAAFKIFIKTERSGDGEIVPKLDVDIGGRLDIKYDADFNQGFLFVAQWIAKTGGL